MRLHVPDSPIVTSGPSSGWFMSDLLKDQVFERVGPRKKTDTISGGVGHLSKPSIRDYSLVTK